MALSFDHDDERNSRHVEKIAREGLAKMFAADPHWLDTTEIDEAKMSEGVKYDEEKPQYSLVPADALHEVAKVLTFGAKKYAPDNWKKVPDLQRRYYDALQRHLFAYQKGETLDPESGLHHLAHAGCCLFFMLQDNLEESE